MFPKLQSKKFIPSLGELHVIGASGLGINIVDATIACNTLQSDAQLIAAPPNTGVGNGYVGGPIVHSLGVPPAVVLMMTKGGSFSFAGPVFRFMTADNSAAYFRAQAFSIGPIPAGIAVRMISIPD